MCVCVCVFWGGRQLSLECGRVRVPESAKKGRLSIFVSLSLGCMAVQQ